MGRNKIKIEKIENTRIRQVTFYKRKKGLIKKSMELSLLCEAKILLCVLDKNEKLTTYISDSETLKDFEEYFYNKSILKENFSNKDYKELFQGSGKNNNSNDSKSDDFDMDNFKNETLRENKFINFNETLNIAGGFGTFNEKSKVRDNCVNEDILKFFNMIKGKNHNSVDYAACQNNLEKLNDSSNTQFPNQKVNLENSISKEFTVPNVSLNNEDGNMLNLNNLLLNYFNSNPSLFNDSSLSSEANPIYSYLINLINNGNICPENLSLFMNNLSEVIKNNLNKTNSISNLISLNQENSEYKDQQANLIEIARKINENKKNLSLMNIPNQNNYDSLMQNIFLTQQNQLKYVFNSNLAGLNSQNNIENITNIIKNFQNSNSLLSGVNSGLHNNNLNSDSFKRELNSNHVPNNIKSPQLRIKNNTQILNKNINVKDKSTNRESNKLNYDNVNRMEEFKDNSGNNNQPQDLMSKKRKRDDLQMKTEGIESFKEMFFKDKMSNPNQNYSNNNGNVTSNLNFSYDINNPIFYNKTLQNPFNEAKNNSATNKNNNSNNPVSNGYLTENPVYSMNNNSQNSNSFGAQNIISNQVSLNNFDFLGNLNNNFNQNLQNFSNSTNQINHNLIQKSNELRAPNTSLKGINNDLNSQNLINKSKQNAPSNNSNYNQAENLGFNFNNNIYYNNNELNKTDFGNHESINNLNTYQQNDFKQSSNNLESFADKRTGIPTENNIINPKTSEKNLALGAKSYKNNAVPGNLSNGNNFKNNENNSNSTGNLNEKSNHSLLDPIKTDSQMAFEGDNLNSFAYSKPEQLMLLNLIQGNFPIGNVNFENVNSILGQFTTNNNNEAFNSVILSSTNNHNGPNNFNNNNSNNNYFQMNNSFDNSNVIKNEIENDK